MPLMLVSLKLNEGDALALVTLSTVMLPVAADSASEIVGVDLRFSAPGQATPTGLFDH